MHRFFRSCRIGVIVVIVGFMAAPPCRADEPMVERYLREGQLQKGAAQIRRHLEDHPADDQARFGLGVIEFLRTFENLGHSLHKYGMRTERVSRRPPPLIQQMFPQNPNPEKISYADVRRIVQVAISDLKRADTTLGKIRDANVKLPIVPAEIKIDLFGQGKLFDGGTLLSQFNPRMSREALGEFEIKFDRGDVDWLRGYCHFLSAWAEVLLAVDGQEVFDCSAHLFFEKVETPHTFLLKDRRPFDDVLRFEWRTIADIVTGFHLSLRFDLAEPKRMENALGHLESMIKHSKRMWTFYEAETDDDREWIPRPGQSGAMGIKVSKEMLASWRATLDEADLLLQGKRLLPFWRMPDGGKGVNLRRVFTDPARIDIVRWVQGTAATPYLEDGKVTRLADEDFLRQLNRQFGGANFFGFAFWFN